MHLNIESLLEIQKNYYDPEEHKTVEEYWKVEADFYTLQA
jgi:hypothetical protein